MSTTNPSAQTALLVMDVQPSTVERYAQNSDLLPRLAQTIAAARAAIIPVLYIRAIRKSVRAINCLRVSSSGHLRFKEL